MTTDRKQLSLVVLAAGIGSRFGGLKQAEPVGPNGELIIDYSIYDALEAGFDHVVLVVQEKLRDAFAERFDPPLASRCAVNYAVQRLDDLPEGFELPPGREKPWGTGQAVLVCQEYISGPFAVINGDDFYGRTSYALLAKHLKSSEAPSDLSAMVIGFDLQSTLSTHGTVSRGICRVGADGWLEGIQERKRVKRLGDTAVYLDEQKRWQALPADAVASMNMWGLPGSFMTRIAARFPEFLGARQQDIETAEYLLPELVGQALQEQVLRVKVRNSDEAWFGMTHREDLEAVRSAIRSLIEAGHYPADLWS